MSSVKYSSVQEVSLMTRLVGSSSPRGSSLVWMGTRLTVCLSRKGVLLKVCGQQGQLLERVIINIINIIIFLFNKEKVG